MKNKILVLIMVVFLLGTMIHGQGNSSIYLLKIKIKDNVYYFSDLQKVTDTKAYNNQPYFLPEGNSILYSSAINKQTEIIRYYINEKKKVRITNNTISEYSPTPMPDGLHFSSVRLYIKEGPKKGDQPLVAIPISGGDARTLYGGKEKVGYHAWMSKDKLALFVLGKPHSLQYYDLRSKKFQLVAKNIGRSIQRVPGKNEVSFSHIKDKENEIIKTVNFDGKNFRQVTQLLKNGDYFTWAAEGILVTASDSRLYKYDIKADKTWVELKDFSKMGLKNISRIAFSKKGDRIALVSND